MQYVVAVPADGKVTTLLLAANFLEYWRPVLAILPSVPQKSCS